MGYLLSISKKILLLSDTNTLSTYFLVNEGIEYRLKENAKKISKVARFSYGFHF